MLDDPIVGGVVAGIPVSLVCLGYVAVRRAAVVRLLTEDAGSGALSRESATALAAAAALCVGPMLGFVAGVVRGWMPSDGVYIALAIGLATAMSLGAVVVRTPMATEKVVLNWLLALMLGIVAPNLVPG